MENGWLCRLFFVSENNVRAHLRGDPGGDLLQLRFAESVLLQYAEKVLDAAVVDVDFCLIHNSSPYKDKGRRSWGGLCILQPNAYAQGRIYFPHLLLIHTAHIFLQAGFVQGAELLQQDGGILKQPAG